MRKRLFSVRFSVLSLMIMLVICTACQPQPEAERQVITPFPTMTPGHIFMGELPLGNVSGQVAPATAVAISRQPTPTPDYAGCLPLTSNDVSLEDTPAASSLIIVEEIVRFLAQGGSLATLQTTLRENWQIVGENGYFRADIDLTGEGSPEIIIGYAVTGEPGALLIAGCADGTYKALFEAESDTIEPPQIIVLGDLNQSQTNDLLFSARSCERNDEGVIVDFEDCRFRTELVTWQPERTRFVNLLPDSVLSDNPPNVTDFDNDQVSEIVVQLESSGTSATGPLRTGVNVYDWDGSSYLLSLVELDPPRYRIQIIWEADRLFSRREWVSAIPVYQLALSDTPNLRYWFDDEVEILRSYTLYRLILAQTASSDIAVNITLQQMEQLYPDPLNAPAYITMARTFYDQFQQTSDVRSACSSVRAIIDGQPDILEALNRYGGNSPQYTAPDLCPF